MREILFQPVVDGTCYRIFYFYFCMLTLVLTAYHSIDIKKYTTKIMHRDIMDPEPIYLSVSSPTHSHKIPAKTHAFVPPYSVYGCTKRCTCSSSVISPKTQSQKHATSPSHHHSLSYPMPSPCTIRHQTVYAVSICHHHHHHC